MIASEPIGYGRMSQTGDTTLPIASGSVAQKLPDPLAFFELFGTRMAGIVVLFFMIYVVSGCQHERKDVSGGTGG